MYLRKNQLCIFIQDDKYTHFRMGTDCTVDSKSFIFFIKSSSQSVSSNKLKLHLKGHWGHQHVYIWPITLNKFLKTIEVLII